MTTISYNLMTKLNNWKTEILNRNNYLEFLSLFILGNSVISFVYITVSYIYFYIATAPWDLVPSDQFVLAPLGLMKISLIWSLQFEFITVFLFVFFFFYMSVLMFYHKKNSALIQEKLINKVLAIVFLLFFYVILVGLNFFFRDLKFFFLENLLILDLWVVFSRIWVLFFLFLFFYYCRNFIFSFSIDLLFLLICGGFVLLLMFSIIDIFLILITLEIISFIILAICIFNASEMSLEASIRYFIYNSIVSGISLFGIFGIFYLIKNFNLIILYYAFNTLDYLFNFKFYFLIISIIMWTLIFLFKLNIFPICFYIADIYESIPFFLIFYLSSIIKPSIFFIFCRLFYFSIINVSIISIIFIIFGLLSMLLSSIMAIDSLKVKRFFGLTSINLNGFMLIALATGSSEVLIFSIVYMLIYNLSIIFIFYFLSNFFIIKDKQPLIFSNLILMAKESTFISKLTLSILIILISGLPPFFLFLYKYLFFLNLLVAGYKILVFFLIVINLISFYYYLNFVRYFWVHDKNENYNKEVLLANYSNISNNIYFFSISVFFLFVILFIFTIFFFDYIYFFLQVFTSSLSYQLSCAVFFIGKPITKNVKKKRSFSSVSDIASPMDFLISSNFLNHISFQKMIELGLLKNAGHFSNYSISYEYQYEGSTITSIQFEENLKYNLKVYGHYCWPTFCTITFSNYFLDRFPVLFGPMKKQILQNECLTALDSIFNAACKSILHKNGSVVKLSDCFNAKGLIEKNINQMYLTDLLIGMFQDINIEGLHRTNFLNVKELWFFKKNEVLKIPTLFDKISIKGSLGQVDITLKQVEIALRSTKDSNFWGIFCWCLCELHLLEVFPNLLDSYDHKAIFEIVSYTINIELCNIVYLQINKKKVIA